MHGYSTWEIVVLLCESASIRSPASALFCMQEDMVRTQSSSRAEAACC
jgi:hypothetical protein